MLPAPSVSASVKDALIESERSTCASGRSRFSERPRQPPSQLQQNMLHFPCAQHGVGDVPSPQTPFVVQHTAVAKGRRAVTPAIQDRYNIVTVMGYRS
jgi:hypothetical protein